MAIRLHFTVPKYDAIKYNYKTSKILNRDDFKRKRDHSFYARLSKKFNKLIDLRDFFVSNWVYRNDIESLSWIGNFIEEESKARQAYTRFLKISEGFTSRFEDDMMLLRDHMLTRGFKNPDYLVDGDSKEIHPPIVSLLLEEKITHETVIAMSRLTPNHLLLKRVDLSIQQSSPVGEDFIWNKLKTKLIKYDRIISSRPMIENEKAKQIILNVFSKEVKNL